MKPVSTGHMSSRPFLSCPQASAQVSFPQKCSTCRLQAKPPQRGSSGSKVCSLQSLPWLIPPGPQASLPPPSSHST